MFTNMEVSISGSHMIGWPSGFSQFEENAQLMKGYNYYGGITMSQVSYRRTNPA